MMTRNLILAGMGGLLLAGCLGTPRQYESAPVTVSTKQGAVVCQLYTRELVLWDRAIDRPETMDVQTADEVCRREGLKIRDAL